MVISATFTNGLKEFVHSAHRTHPNERILEVDAPLSYGMADVKQEPATLNSVSFLWDPTRDTGVFVKVHCISTEFTPKKHGGERGVPFRLQVYSHRCHKN